MGKIKEVVLPVQLLTEKAFRPFGVIIDQPIRIKPAFSSEFMEYWNVTQFDTNAPMAIIYMNLLARPLVLDSLERHTKTQELLMPIKGISVLPVALTNKTDEHAIPSYDRIAAFLLSPQKAILLNKGVWHWAPYPLSESSSFIVIVRSETIEKDLDIKSLKESFEVCFKLSLKEFSHRLDSM